MEEETKVDSVEKMASLFWFKEGEGSYGIDLTSVREVISHVTITPVHRVAPYVVGVVNVRGQIVTVIDLEKRLGRKSPTKASNHLVLLLHKGETIGLLAESVEDVVQVQEGALESPPSHVSGVDSRFLKSVYQLPDTLLAVLNLDEVLSVGEV